MPTDARTQLRTGYEAGPVTKAPAWHGLVAWDMLFNNLTTGLFLVAALGKLAASEVFTPVAKAAYPLALVLLLTDLMCLVLAVLGRPRKRWPPLISTYRAFLALRYQGFGRFMVNLPFNDGLGRKAHLRTPAR